MRKLSFIIIFSFLLITNAIGQNSPHGKNFNIPCQQCHVTESWKVQPNKIKFNHDKTGFKLTGQHKQIKCQNCHKDLHFTIKNATCNSCHTDIHQGSVGRDCQKCHDTNSWLVKDILDIHRFSRFPLIGAHLQADCQECHADAQHLNFTAMGLDCYSCHQNDYLNAKNPDHIAMNYSKECSDCHIATGWQPALFDHDSKFFPIFSGEHSGKWNACSDCHTTQNYSQFTCFNCHAHERSRMDDKHRNISGYVYESTACYACHPNGSGDDSFNHARTNFPLIGAHKNLNCQECHQNGYNNTPSECYSCHQNNYESTDNPPHSSLGFSHECTQCHTQSAWKPATFDHDASNFPIFSGSHNNKWQQCSDCHYNQNDYSQFSCTNCHEHNQSATDSKHSNVSGYVYESTACYACHPTGSGDDAFDHSQTNFPLLGAHKNLDCQQCHQNGYNNIPSDCYSCHQTNFENTTNPPHLSLGFSHDCTQCHTQTAWQPATFDHDNSYFPIFSGEHNNKWQQCSDCHYNQDDYAQFSCTTCHEHNQSSMDSEHSDVTGYVYESSACYACHPTGSGDGAFDHSQSNFPLLGAHRNLDCQQCHQNGYNNLPSDCYSCHQNNFDNANDPPHLSLGFSHDCTLCHTQSAWQPATFDHDASYFPIFSGEHNNKWQHCSDCHYDQNDYGQFSCINCHEHNRSSMDSEHSEVSGYVYESSACYNCHPTGSGDDGGGKFKNKFKKLFRIR